jgi:hypothetical protein
MPAEKAPFLPGVFSALMPAEKAPFLHNANQTWNCFTHKAGSASGGNQKALPP